MHTVLLVVHILVAAALIALVLIQQGKGADMGAAFGSGASSTVFGSRGSASFLTRATAVLAILFFVLTGLLAFSSTQKREIKSATELVAPQAPTTPATKTPATKPESSSQPSPAGSTTQTKPGDVPVVPDK
ncbi:MAG: preprotein translocase subunit SecG [Gammaproteobacteria bacterium]|jgi:preprotein translocase subunit SecG